MIPTQLKNPNFRFCLIRKQSKIPFEKNWQILGYKWDDPKLQQHIKNGGNYGVIGGYGNLIILDKDSDKLDIDLETFCVETGSGGRHYYFLSDYNSNHVFTNNLGELRADNYQCVGAGSIHPNLKPYKVHKDLPLKNISSEEVLKLIEPYLKTEKIISGKWNNPKEEIKLSQKFNKILETNEKIKKLYHGDFEGYDLSIGGELALVCFLIQQDLDKKEIFNIMATSKIGRWAERGVSYRNQTYKKALAKITEKSDFIPSETDKLKLEKAIVGYLGKKDLAEQILNIQPIHYNDKRIWWTWNKELYKWEIVDETDILNLVNQLSIANTIKAKEKMEILESLKQESRLRKPKENKKTWLQFHDTIFDIQTGEEFKATSKYFVTNPIPYKLNQEKFENTPTMDKIFEEWVGKEYVRILYEIIAYCLIPDYPMHRIFCLIGAGMNGKSCFLNLLRKFVGKDNVCSTELDVLLSSRFEITRLHKKLVCQMGETNFNEMKKTSILKKLSGGDLIGFEYKNKDPFEEHNYAKIIIATNNLPTTTDKTIGFYRRWCIINFPNQFSEKKDILDDIPEEEYECLALKCTTILKDLLRKREFTKEGEIEDRMKKYEDYSDPLGKFFKEFIEEDVEGTIWKYEFEKKLNEWLKENNFRYMSEVVIGKKMKEKGIHQILKQADWVMDGVQKKYRAWVGIVWKDSQEQVEQEEQVMSTQFSRRGIE